MRVHLSAQALPGHVLAADPSPVLLTIRSVHWLWSHAEHRTTAPDLLTLLRRRTDVNALALDRFQNELSKGQSARLADVELNDEVLERLGFFLD
jgi:hypothetical protein